MIINGEYIDSDSATHVHVFEDGRIKLTLKDGRTVMVADSDLDTDEDRWLLRKVEAMRREQAPVAEKAKTMASKLKISLHFRIGRGVVHLKDIDVYKFPNEHEWTKAETDLPDVFILEASPDGKFVNVRPILRVLKEKGDLDRLKQRDSRQSVTITAKAISDYEPPESRYPRSTWRQVLLPREWGRRIKRGILRFLRS